MDNLGKSAEKSDPDRPEPLEHARLRQAVQFAQERYEQVLTQENAEDGDELDAPEMQLSEAHAAFDRYLNSTG